MREPRTGLRRGKGLVYRSKHFTRREALKLAALGSAGLLLPLERFAGAAGGSSANRIASSALPAPFSRPFVRPPVLSPVRTDATTDYYRLTQQQALVEILPGQQTPILGYNGITPGPTIVAQRGRHVVVRQINALPPLHPTLGYTPYTSTHLHGSASLPEYDGYASDITQPGQCKDYHYPNIQDARTLWYHDHGVGITAQNAYLGWRPSTTCTTRSSRRSPLPARRLRRAAHHQGRDVRGRRLADLRRPQPVRHVRRRHPRQRTALAGDAGRAAQVPLPHAQRVGLALATAASLDTGEPMTVIATRRRARCPHRSRSPTSASAWPSATRWSSTSRSTAIGQRVVLQNLQPEEQHRLSPTPTR